MFFCGDEIKLYRHLLAWHAYVSVFNSFGSCGRIIFYSVSAEGIL